MYEVQHLLKAHGRDMAGLAHDLRHSNRRLRRERDRLERTCAQARMIPLDEDHVAPPCDPLVRRGLTLLLALVLTLL